MAILRSTCGVVILLAATASQVVGQVLAGPRGPVEFIGLERWSAPELLEAIQRIAPDQPLHACAVTMKSQLGFADAAVVVHYDSYSPEFLASDDAEPYMVIVGVEDRARVRYGTPGGETIPLPERWQALKSLAEENFGTLVMAAEMFHSRHDPESVREHVEVVGMDPADPGPIWERIGSMDAERDRLLAHEILAHDASWSSRVTATIVLVNFSIHEAAWHDLISTLIHPEVRVRGAAEAVLRGLLEGNKVRAVDWHGAREPLMALLDGTNPYVFQTVLRALVATEVEPGFARQLIRRASDLLLAHAGAAHEGTREPAMALLTMVSGEDFGADPDAWAEWLSGLPEVF